jgi:hypothetical protein
MSLSCDDPNAQQGQSHDTTCHDPCCCTARARSCRGSSLTLGKSMPSVLIFSSVGTFRAESELDAYVRPTYDEDGRVRVSAFMQEVGLSSNESMCIEAAWEERAVPLRELVDGCSYSDQWAHLVPDVLRADSACWSIPQMLWRTRRARRKFDSMPRFRIRHPDDQTAQQGARANAGICHASCSWQCLRFRTADGARVAPAPVVAHL